MFIERQDMDDRIGLGDVIAATFATWEHPLRDGGLDRERSIYGTVDPEEIARVVDDFCVAALGARIDTYLFYAVSQGSVSGVRLTDGRRVVVKARTSTWTLPFLDAVYRVQSYLVAHGFPCPRPLLQPAPLGQGYATVEELVDEGEYADAHIPAIRRAMASTLARLVAATHALRDTPELRAGLQSRMPFRRPTDSIWPVPHNPMFDFEATTSGAEWIDHLAATAREALARGAGGLVIGHTDWSAQNCRFVDETIHVVYDWDSLMLDKEPIIVAEAAMTFAFNWLLPGPQIAPSPDEARAFVREYEEARGAPFTAAEWESITAAATYALAYGARLEHSLSPAQTDYPSDGARARLAQYGDAFLVP